MGFAREMTYEKIYLTSNFSFKFLRDHCRYRRSSPIPLVTYNCLKWQSPKIQSITPPAPSHNTLLDHLLHHLSPPSSTSTSLYHINSLSSHHHILHQHCHPHLLYHHFHIFPSLLPSAPNLHFSNSNSSSNSELLLLRQGSGMLLFQ